ncbi:MAG TPA: hypothetical protein VFN35_23810 [Ktedonobacteraceae bacterium]|nr:hypothetical protein [Ktedonobacteraceae bacterium]
MFTQKGRLLFFALVCLFCTALIVACGGAAQTTSGVNAGRDSGASQSGNSVVGVTPTGTISLISAPAESADTSCPAPTKVRAVMMPSLQQSGHQQIVYYHNIGDQMVLNLFDVQRKAATIITGQNEHIQSAQLSQDGSWVLMVVSSNDISALQLIRIDGRYFQTLYCAPQGQEIGASAQWSPDQRQVLFSQGTSSDSGPLYMLQLTGGSIHTELSASGLTLTPLTWLDNLRAYVRVQSSALYLLDTSKGSNQRIKNMKLVEGAGDMVWDFDSSTDATTLFLSLALAEQNSTNQSQLMIASADGQGTRKILSSARLTIVGVRVIDASSLMLASYTQDGPRAAYNGFWKVHNDGSSLTRLNNRLQMGSSPDSWGPFNPSTQYIWSNFSRDNTLYADGLFYGSLKGGPLTRYASDDEGDGNILVGWTTV